MDLKVLLEKIERERDINLPFSLEINQKEVEKLKKKLPNLNYQDLFLLSLVTPILTIENYTEEELLFIANSNLDRMFYSGEKDECVCVMNGDRVYRDEGVIIGDISYTDVSREYKKAMVTNKSLNKSFLSMYLTTLI